MRASQLLNQRLDHISGYWGTWRPWPGVSDRSLISPTPSRWLTSLPTSVTDTASQDRLRRSSLRQSGSQSQRVTLTLHTHAAIAVLKVNLERTITFRNSKQSYTGIPIIAANMDTVGTFEMAKALGKHKIFTAIHKHYSMAEWTDFAEKNQDVMQHVAASAGMAKDDFERLSQILTNVPTVKFICLDVANGYSEHFVEYVKQVRQAFPKHTIMAGNVVTGEMVEELLLAGADIIKVGIGPGSVCTTRKMTGVGYPQLSAVIESGDAAHGLGGHIISDGGCVCPGDICKAFGAGADFVMLGGMLAGHEQSGGETVEKDGKKFKMFYGMSSVTAMAKHAGGVAEYRASEGKTVMIPFRGEVDSSVQDILGGLRSACTYVGASKLRELPKRTTFLRVTQQVNEAFQ